MPSAILPKRILVPLDGSDPSFQAAKYAIKLAKMAKAEIIFMHAVVNPPYVEYKAAGLVIVRYIEEAKRHSEMWYKNLGELAAKEGVKASSETILDIASAADSIIKYAESKNVDLIVMGTHGRTGIKRFLIGSVANGVVTHAKCSVLVVR
ncbi:putative UspA domain protein [Candidatus Nitrososphaera gargensis Ga9.2]|uniref:Putative UspA domain protein n=1 Tax=Nitrososphaera gargensis (strain Ga9.2) TaxID=1237085 RepID=K0IGL5_NITGG|nr:universal stress protein [Candidatus Nitrososphaera gargensis]AFU58955.1 putative UspA domain protein [Candidatus Nitrososphaera gargensis Ga9.2]